MAVIYTVYLAMIFMFVTPFNMGLNSFMSLNSKRAGGTFTLGFFSARLSLQSGREGWELDGAGKGESKAPSKASGIRLDKRMLSQIYVKKAAITFLYGKKDDAFKTSAVCGAVNGLFSAALYAFRERIDAYKLVVLPSFGKEYLFLQVRLDFKINLLIIFTALFKIIISKVVGILRRIDL